MIWGKPKCPVRAEEQLWIEDSLDWLGSEFGTDLLRRPVVLPETSFLPAGYTGTAEDVLAVFETVAARLDVPLGRVEVEIDPEEEDDDLADAVPLNSRSTAAAGHWRQRDGRTVVGIQLAQARYPVALIATIAHELGHERLLGEERIARDRRDGEPLTDLFTVFAGFGIFNANSAFEFRSSHSSWSTTRLGYLTEPMYGYALALYAWLRGEPDPPWARHLDTNPRTYLKQGLRYLRGQEVR